MFYWFVQVILWYLQAIEPIHRAAQEILREETKQTLNAAVVLLAVAGLILLAGIFVALFMAACSILESRFARWRSVTH
jgi:hypothetical protein